MNENPNRISWQELFMEIAKIAAKRSCDPKTAVGCCLVKENCVIGIGYNGTPRNFKYNFDWATPEKYDFCIHSEANAILNAQAIGCNPAGGDIYVTLSPCHDCIKLICQARIKRVFYLTEYKDFDLTKKIADAAGVELIKVDL